ncbi:fat-like cadherin-related tumor suppressor homolog [Eriocheir sinensis]|uniref:fat-like cadherin-related tumor suppressor homolog n=1 Tax=Eriocheir sinensis TaxID=95602 RepID=UPI0021C7B60C|nr:fat-like cadherin-related tumor suppressor homolog [Eriocheir sinensis]
MGCKFSPTVDGKSAGELKLSENTNGYLLASLTPPLPPPSQIQVKDNGAPQLTATTRVLLRVVDVPEASPNPPVLQPPPPAHVMETDAPGHLVSFINAQDPDNDTLWYYITEGDESGRFSLGVDSGLVSLARRLTTRSSTTTPSLSRPQTASTLPPPSVGLYGTEHTNNLTHSRP